MKKVFISLSLVAVCGFANAQPKIEFLQGDEKLACEALMCLSVKPSDRPKECEPAIHKYNSIKFKKSWKTAKARQDFLDLCPKD